LTRESVRRIAKKVSEGGGEQHRVGEKGRDDQGGLPKMVACVTSSIHHKGGKGRGDSGKKKNLI